MPKEPELTEVEYEKELRTSEKSVLFKFVDGTECWIPKTQIYRQDEYGDGSGCVHIPEWLAKDRDLV